MSLSNYILIGSSSEYLEKYNNDNHELLRTSNKYVNYILPLSVAKTRRPQ
jgi:hypothetical protein